MQDPENTRNARRSGAVDARSGHGARRSWRRPLLVFVGTLFALVILLWLSVGAWAPLAAGPFLPEGWRLTEARVGLPTPSGTRFPTLRLRGRLAGYDITVTANDARLRHAGPAVVIEQLEVELIPTESDIATVPAAFDPSGVSLPLLPRPTQLPRVEVGELRLRLQASGAVREWNLRDLVLEGGGDVLDVTVRVDEPPMFRSPLTVKINLQDDGGTVLLTLDDQEAPLIAYEQSPAAGGFQGRLNLDLDLSRLEANDLSAFLDRRGAAAIETLAGRLRARLALEGPDRLVPRTLNVDLDGVRVASSDAGLDADGALDMRREGDRLALDLHRLRLEVGTGDDRAARWLGERLETFGVTGGVGPGPMALTLVVPEGPVPPSGNAGGPDTPPPVAARFDLQTGRPLRFDGAGRLGWAQPDGGHVSLQVRDGRFVPGDGANAGSQGDLDLSLRLVHPLRGRLGEASVGASTADLALGLAVEHPAGAPLAASGRLEVLELAGFSLANPSLAAKFDVLRAEGDLAWSGKGLAFDGPLAGDGLVVAPVDAVAANSLLTAGSARLDLQATGRDALTVTGSGALAGVALPDLGARMDNVDLVIHSLALPAMDGRLGLLTTGLEAVLDETTYSGLDLDLEGTLADGERVSGDGELLLGFSGALPFAFELDLDTAALDVALDEAALPAAALRDAARALALSLPEALRFVDGGLIIDGALSLDEAGLGGALDITGDALGMALGESRFEGLSFTTRFDLGEAITGGGPLLLELAQLAAGLDLVALDTELAIEGPADLGLITLDAELLGGRLSAPALRLVDGRVQDTTIEWSGFDLGRLLSFVDVNGLDGSGTLDARLPLVGGEDGLSVVGGRFDARGPGRLRYSTGGPATNIGLQALENFEYEELGGTLDYDANGDYTVVVELLGRNPDLYGGHPIRFRLNLGGAMPALFRSLFVTGDFDKAIIERLRAGESPLEETP